MQCDACCPKADWKWLKLVLQQFIQDNLVEAHCYGIGRTGQIFEQSRSSGENR